MVPTTLSQLQRCDFEDCVCTHSKHKLCVLFMKILGLCHAVSIREQLIKLLKRFKIPLTSCEGTTTSCCWYYSILRNPQVILSLSRGVLCQGSSRMLPDSTILGRIAPCVATTPS